jgi:NitT/TauT family transport system permease protein
VSTSARWLRRGGGTGARNDAPTTFAGLFAIAIMGILMYAVCAMVERRMTRWAFRGEMVG